jgi:two-component system, chemotaxis family, chemotaxis protein CheY
LQFDWHFSKTASVATDRRKENAAVTAVDYSTLRMLIVDDNTNMRRILRTLLVGLGARTILEADDGVAALELFRDHLPDIVITDWVMPVLDGLDLVRILRNEKESPNPFVPIIVVTAYTDRTRVLQARDAGVTEFIAKPLSAKVLHDRISSVVLRPREFVRTKTFFGPDRRRFAMPNFGGEDRRTEPPRIVERKR